MEIQKILLSKYMSDKIPPTQIKILGKFYNSIKPKTSNQPYETICLQSPMSTFPHQPNSKYNFENKIKPKKIFADGSLLAAIDVLNNLWFFSDIFAHPINISSLLHKKIRSIFLSQNECILGNKKNPILLNWGGKKILKMEKLEPLKISQKISKQQPNFFKAYSINESQKDDIFYYSLCQKIQNTNKLYQIETRNQKNTKDDKDITEKQQVSTITAYPTNTIFTVKHKVVGISVGKYHTMCWTDVGKAFTWGNRSIALGYENLPQEKLTTKPRIVEKLSCFVTMGFAGTHYSLALCSEGIVYQWGVKQDPNQLNEELIFEPTVVNFVEGEHQPKIVILKGSKDQYGCLTSSHQLYVWGHKLAHILPEYYQTSSKWKNQNIFSPILIPHLNQVNIVDFCFGSTFVAVLTAPIESQMMAEGEKVYWDDMIKRVKLKLNQKNLKTETSCPNLFYKKKIKRTQMNQTPLCDNFNHLYQQPTNRVQKAYQQRNLKKQYFNKLRNQPKLFSTLMDNSKQNLPTSLSKRFKRSQKCLSTKNRRLYSEEIQETEKNKLTIVHFTSKSKNLQILDHSDKSSPRKTDRKMQQSQDNKLMLKKTLPDNLYNHLSIKKRSNCSTSAKKKFISRVTDKDGHHYKKQKQDFNLKLQKVLQKKKSLEEYYLNSVVKKVEENSIEFRNKRHDEIFKAKTEERLKNVLKNTLQAFLVKNLLIKAFVSPIEEARQLKIQQFGRNLHLSRIQKNLRKVFIQGRVRLGLKKLTKLNFLTYAKLCYYFRRYVEKKRKEKAIRMKKLVAQQIFKSVIKLKIKFGLSKTNLNVRKLQKFRQWLVITKTERIKCLKILWKNHLLSVVKISSESEFGMITKPSNSQNCTFEHLYKEKIASNPMLKLQHFLMKSPIFQLRSEYFHSIMFLFKKQNTKKPLQYQEIKKKLKKQRIKFNGDGDIFNQVVNSQSNSCDLFPYSLHYNILTRPKSMQITIPENMKRNEKWIKEEKSIFEKILQQIIQQYQRKYRKDRRVYDRELALFIKEKYQSLSEKRWKCILEFNQLKTTKTKRKKQKQLYRIFDLIGSRKTLNQDCLPEKYLMLEESVKRKDAPNAPNPCLTFSMKDFREYFKKYYQIIFYRAKTMRKNFI